MCKRGWELPASFHHELVSHSMGAADCSMAAPGPMLPLCQDLTSLDYHHNIHQLSSTQPHSPPPPPTPTPLLPTQPPLHPVPTPSRIPPAGSPLNDTLSICLIISPLATPPRPSLHRTFCSQGSAEGPGTLQQDFLTINPSLPSSKLWVTLSSQRIYFKNINAASSTTVSYNAKNISHYKDRL